MNPILQRGVLFLVPFSLVFWYMHEQFESAIFRSIQNGLSGFYSADGIIFGLIVAFVIQREWEIWTKLSESVQTEIDAVRELWKWSSFAEPSLCNEAHHHLEQYLKCIVSEWHKGGEAERSKSVDDELDALRSMVAAMSASVGSLSFQLQGAFTNLVQARNQRLSFGNQHMPGILKRIVIFADMLLILLSLFIAVNNLYIDYIFTASIGLLAFALILVVDDLDNPFRPGAWHLTTAGYEAILAELTH
ncbi:MAG: DUF4239 domain-containing protein [Minisyncoccia bacterium]